MLHTRSFRSRVTNRRGNIAIIAAFVLPVVIGFVAFAIDWGQIAVARSELQNAADSAALAAGSKMMHDRAELYLYTPLLAASVDGTFYSSARDEAQTFALANKVRGTTVAIDKQADVEFFYTDPETKAQSNADPTIYNTVRVTTRRSGALNGPVPLFISGFFGFKEVSMTAVAQATFYDQVTAIRRPPKGTKNSIMPFAIKRSDWEKALAGQFLDIDGDGKSEVGDNYSNDDGDISKNTSDGLSELAMYPDSSGKSGNLTPGNFGTVNVGASANSASHLADQISNGMSDSDWDYHNGELDFSNGFDLTGDTGISAGIKDELLKIVGETRTIFLYDTVDGNGNGAVFKIVGFAGIRVMDSVLTGNNKAIYIQPAPVSDPGAVGGTGLPQWNLQAPLCLTQ